MITKDVYQKRLLASKADTVVFNEVFDYLEAKSTACRIDAENLQQKGIDTLSREEYERIIENLSKSLAAIYKNCFRMNSAEGQKTSSAFKGSTNTNLTKTLNEACFSYTMARKMYPNRKNRHSQKCLYKRVCPNLSTNYIVAI